MSIQKRELNKDERINYSAYHFGDNFPFRIEPTIYTFADSLSCDYNGGYWHMYELTNGGFYMAPDEDMPFRVECMNGYEGTMSADGFGICACLYAFSNLSFTDDEEFAGDCTEQYHLLREYMMQHPDCLAILAAID